MTIESAEELLDLMRGYQISCVLAAATDLELFQLLAETPLDTETAAERMDCDIRATGILLDALSGIGVLTKESSGYVLAPKLAPLLLDQSRDSVIAMMRHQANCLRRWSHLPWAVQSGGPADAGPSLRGPEADHEAFIQAMHAINNQVADSLVREVNPGDVRCVLDIGGATGTWTLAWLEAEPQTRAILFDLPSVIPMARKRIEEAGAAERVDLVPGDFYTAPLPQGADLAWVSAIIHQNSRDQNRDLFRRIAEALSPGGRVLIRDIVMEDSHTEPLSGALFAVNMLVATDGGNTYTLAEIREDLTVAGFGDVRLVRRDEGMHAVVSARLGV